MTEPKAAPPDVREEHARLAQEIDENAYRYYVLDDPTVSDAEYDAAMRRLRPSSWSSRPCRAPIRDSVAAISRRTSDRRLRSPAFRPS